MKTKRVVLIHYGAEEGAARAEALKKAGYAVEVRAPKTPQDLRALYDRPPDGFVVDLDRRPSDARAIAVALRQRKATRLVPMVLVGAAPEKARQLGKQFPDVAQVEWRRIRSALAAALRRPPVDPHRPDMMVGYAGRPLAKKLGLRAGMTVAMLGAPKNFDKTLGDMWKQIRVKSRARGTADMVMLFVKTEAELAKRLSAAQRTMIECGSIWIAWPKKSARVPGDITQTHVRKTGLAAGLVDYKICAIDETWSGLRFARRKRIRSNK